MNFEAYCDNKLGLINEYIESSLNRLRDGVSQRFSPLVDAMQYSLEGKGKRLRPLLVLASADYLDIPSESVLPVAASVEYIHTYSLIHDDLPSMDDDDFRRGKPANHKKFGEATAILAGDALLTESFRQLNTLAEKKVFEPAHILNALQLLAQHSGVGGLVGGQSLDIQNNDAEYTLPELEFIHIHKTGSLILASVMLPTALVKLPQEKVDQLRRYGEALGLAFQISDDLLDAEAGLRYARGPRSKPSPNYTQLMGMTEVRQRLTDLIDSAIHAVSENGEKAEPLVEIAKFIRSRKH